MTGRAPPSPFFFEQRQRLREAARLGPVLDLACGRGRHTFAAAADGSHVIAMDRNPEFLGQLWHRVRRRRQRVFPVRADVENPPEIPLRSASCGAVLVFRFLVRPLAAGIVEVLRPGGLLLYETFTEGQRQLAGGPRSPDHLLADGELPELFPQLEVLSFWQGVTGGEAPAAIARLAARKPA